MRSVRVALPLTALVLAAGCQVDTRVAVEVEDDGSGRVEVTVALDEAAAARVPELADQLEVDDLVADGWTVTGPAPEADGSTRIRASKGFDSAEEAPSVLAEVAGAEGPFRDLQVVSRPTLLDDVWVLDGTVDLTAGLAGFSDDALRARLDGTDVGRPVAEIEAEAGRPIADIVTFEVAVRLPGELATNGGIDGERAVWAPRLGERLDLAATGTTLRTTTALWLGAAGVALAALVALVARRAFSWRRHR